MSRLCAIACGGFLNGSAAGAAVGSIGMAALVCGGVWSALSRPTRRTRTVIRHLAAGTVFAGLVGDVLQKLLKTNLLWWIALGMALGLALMLIIRVGEGSKAGAALAPFIVADVLIDGVLMGLSVASGSSITIVFVIALAPELALLGMTLSDELGGREWGAIQRIGTPALLGVGVVVGGILGAWAQSGPRPLSIAIEGFGAIALAYLVTEALLREAHEQEETPWMSAVFFLGFVPLFLAAAAVSH